MNVQDRLRESEELQRGKDVPIELSNDPSFGNRKSETISLGCDVDPSCGPSVFHDANDDGTSVRRRRECSGSRVRVNRRETLRERKHDESSLEEEMLFPAEDDERRKCVTSLSQSSLLLSECEDRTPSDRFEHLCGPHRWRYRYRTLLRQGIGELLGTFLLILFGTGSVAVAVTTGALQGLWQVAVIWGIAVTISIVCAGEYSGAHLNPAVSLSFALLRPYQFSWRRLPLFMGAQLVGAFLGGLVMFACFHTLIAEFESENGLVRGEKNSERSAMLFGEYFPNPDMFVHLTPEKRNDLVSPFGAMAIEALGTGILCFVIFALTDNRPTNASTSAKVLTPYFIGVTVAILISIFAPFTQAGWNPARDLGPRLVACFMGWWKIAIPGPRAGFWVYLVGPFIGGPLGAALYCGLRWIMVGSEMNPQCLPVSTTSCLPVCVTSCDRKSSLENSAQPLASSETFLHPEDHHDPSFLPQHSL